MKLPGLAQTLKKRNVASRFDVGVGTKDNQPRRASWKHLFWHYNRNMKQKSEMKVDIDTILDKCTN